MLKQKKEGLIDEKLLEGAEIPSFIKFLQMEKERHQVDILMINKTIENLTKHNSRTIQSAEMVTTCPKCHSQDIDMKKEICRKCGYTAD